MESIAERLTELRKKYHFSRTDVAKLIGVTPSLISSYENHGRKPSLDKLISLADIFHVSTDYILGRTYVTENDVLISMDGLSDNQIKIIRELISEFKKN